MSGEQMVRKFNAEDGGHLEVPKGNISQPLKVTDQTYVLRDRTEPNDTSFLSIDRATGDVSGSSYSVTGDSTFRDVTTGHCTPVSGPTL
jgi:hypothetical protein